MAMNPLQQRLMRAITGSPGEPNLDDLLDRSDRLMEGAAAEPVGSGNGSKPRHTFAGKNPFSAMSPGQMLRYLPAGASEVVSFLASMRKIRGSGRAWRGMDPARPRFPEAGLPSMLDAELHRLGARSWGMVEIPSWAVFAGKVAPFPRALVFTGAMDAETVAKAPDFDVLPEVARAYGSVGRIGNRLATALGRRGIRALPGHPLGGVVDYAALGQLAGIGWVGRSGMLISPADGPCQRIGLVYVDLPLFEPSPRVDHSWIGAFCASCGACARRCPVGAIPGGPAERTPRTRGADGDLCLPYFHANWGCSACIAACPFTKVGHDRIKASFERGHARGLVAGSAQPPASI
jgi:ferredoxin